MGNVDLIREGVQSWNQWRLSNPTVQVDLRGAELAGADLSDIHLEDVTLTGANLAGAVLQRSSLNRADLRGAQLRGADLRAADLRSAVLTDLVGAQGNTIVDLTGADFTGAVFGWTVLGHIYLNRLVGLGSIRHLGPSYITTSTLEFTAEEVRKGRALRTDVESFLKGAGIPLDSFSQFENALRAHKYDSAFISYSHSDQGFARWLDEELRRCGVRCWLDEKNMRPGERILDAIQKAVSSHDRILLCCSADSLESWWVQDEIRKMQELERQSRTNRIIPILLDMHLIDTWENGLATDLRSRLAIDCQRWRERFVGETLIERLLEALRKPV